MDRIFAKIEDRWLTWRTGKDKITRDYEEWCNVNINFRAGTAEARYKNFKYVMQVNFWKFFDVHMVVEPKEDLIQYRYPHRPLGDNMVYSVLRGEEMPDGKFHLTDFGKEDRLYVATNNAEDAMMISLKYA